MQIGSALRIAVVGLTAAVVCACGPQPTDIPAAAITFTPDGMVFQLQANVLGGQVEVKSTGVIPAVITAVEVDVSDGATTDIVKTVDTPNSCLHPLTSIATVAFRTLKPGETCEIALEVARRHVGKGELRVLSNDQPLGSMVVNVAP